jgi:arginase family enzyme
MTIITVPIEHSNDNLGCRKAPEKILSFLSNLVINETGKEINPDEFEINNLDFSGLSNEEAFDLLYKNGLKFFNFGIKKIFLGGDHSISFSLAKSFFDSCKDKKLNPVLIVFDAHPDCKPFLNDEKIPNNVQWLRGLVDYGFPSENIILIGIRNVSMEEKLFLQNYKIRNYNMKDMNDLEEICDIVMELVNKSEIYISIDIDVVDSVFVPGTSRPESGGMTSRQLIYFIQRLNLLKGIRFIDITEINPDKDFRDVTVGLGAKIVGEII